MEEEVHKSMADLSDKDVQKILRKEHPELLVMLPDLLSKLKSLSSVIPPLASNLKQNPPILSSVGEEFTDTKIQSYLNYCLMLGSYMLLKSEKKNLQDHPIMHYLVKSRYSMWL